MRMIVKTSELTGIALDWAVAVAEGYTCKGESITRNNPLDDGALEHVWIKDYSPSTVWAQGGPIIEREGISIVLDWDVVGEFLWGATRIEGPAVSSEQGPTPLIAAMRCYVASKLGDEVAIPDGLV